MKTTFTNNGDGDVAADDSAEIQNREIIKEEEPCEHIRVSEPEIKGKKRGRKPKRKKTVKSQLAAVTEEDDKPLKTEDDEEDKSSKVAGEVTGDDSEVIENREIKEEPCDDEQHIRVSEPEIKGKKRGRKPKKMKTVTEEHKSSKTEEEDESPKKEDDEEDESPKTEEEEDESPKIEEDESSKAEDLVINDNWEVRRSSRRKTNRIPIYGDPYSDLDLDLRKTRKKKKKKIDNSEADNDSSKKMEKRTKCCARRPQLDEDVIFNSFFINI